MKKNRSPRKKRRAPKTILRPPDLERFGHAFLDNPQVVERVLESPIGLEGRAARELLIDHAVRARDDGIGHLVSITRADHHHAARFRSVIDSDSQFIFRHEFQ